MFSYICTSLMIEILKNIIMNFIIQKLKSKHTFLKKYTNWAQLINPAYNYKFQLKTTQVLKSYL